MRKSLLITLLLLCCFHFSEAQRANRAAIESGFLRIAKKEFQVTETRIKSDTLIVVSLSEFLFYPFGKYTDVGQFIKRSNIEWYRSVDRFIYNDTSDMTVYKFWRLDDSFLNFFISINSEFMEILSADITDSEIVLRNQSRTGMPKQEFFNLFFNYPSKNMFEDINYVKFISGLYEIVHVYEFDKDELKRIQFLTEYNYR